MVVERLGHSPPLPPVSFTPVGAARSRPGRQVGDSYQTQKLLACSNQRDTTYSPFTLYLLPSPTQVGDAGRVRALVYRYKIGSVSVCGTALFFPISSKPVGAARSRPGRQVGDPYQAQKLLACSNQRDTTYSPFTLTYYLRPRRWAMPGGLGHQRIGTSPAASLSVVADDKKSLADWRDFSVCVGITYLPGKSPCKYCRRR